MIDSVSSLLFAPTPRSFRNAQRGAVSGEQRVFLTGNTVIEAARAGAALSTSAGMERFRAGKRTMFVTLHRRENMGERHSLVIRALRRVLESNLDLELLIPVHPNPDVRSLVQRELGSVERARVIPPLGYFETLQAIRGSSLIVSDSGGIQEEAPALGRRVLVARETTERPEGIEAGWAEVLPFDERGMIDAIERSLASEVNLDASGMTPYGDGLASDRIADIIGAFLTGRSRKTDDLSENQWGMAFPRTR